MSAPTTARCPYCDRLVAVDLGALVVHSVGASLCAGSLGAVRGAPPAVMAVRR